MPVPINTTDFLLEKNWETLRHAIKERWPEILDVELDLINGRGDMLAGILQEHYWITKDEAEKQLRDFLEEFCSAKIASV